MKYAQPNRNPRVEPNNTTNERPQKQKKDLYVRILMNMERDSRNADRERHVMVNAYSCTTSCLNIALDNISISNGRCFSE